MRDGPEIPSFFPKHKKHSCPIPPTPQSIHMLLSVIADYDRTNFVQKYSKVGLMATLILVKSGKQ